MSIIILGSEFCQEVRFLYFSLSWGDGKEAAALRAVPRFAVGLTGAERLHERIPFVIT